jgi:uncharacterized protein YkwD
MMHAIWILVAGLPLVLMGCERPLALSPKPAKTTTSAVAPRDAAHQPQALTEMEAEVMRRINEIRREHHLRPLQPNEKLAAVARAYSRRMAREHFFDHTGPPGDTTADRVRAAGIQYSFLGENIFKSVNAPDPVALAVQGWMKSPGHRKNILRPEFTETGVGIWREGNSSYITQIFLRPPPS